MSSVIILKIDLKVLDIKKRQISYFTILKND